MSSQDDAVEDEVPEIEAEDRIHGSEDEELIGHIGCPGVCSYNGMLDDPAEGLVKALVYMRGLPLKYGSRGCDRVDVL